MATVAELVVEEGKGFGGNAAKNNAATFGTRGDHNGALVEDTAGLVGHQNGAMLGHTEEEMAHLRNRTLVTHEGEAYCPNPAIRDLPKEFETRVQVIQRYPEMRTIEKTDFVKEIHQEERVVIVPKTRMVYDEVERIDRIPVVKEVPRTRTEIVYRVVEEEREVTDMVPIVEYMDVSRIELVPRVITENVEEKVTIPVIREVPITRMVEVPTGNYCEAPAGEFVNPGDFDLLHHDHHHHHGGHTIADHLLNRSSSSSSSSSSSDDGSPAGRDAATMANADGTPKKKPSLLHRIIHH